MKKTFLIAGLIAGLTATNGYAVQSQTVVVTFVCPPGCELYTSMSTSGYTYARCDCGKFDTDPEVVIQDTQPSPSEIQNIMGQSALNQAAIKDAKKMKTTSARVATISPKVVKKVVYEEIVKDNDAE